MNRTANGCFPRTKKRYFRRVNLSTKIGRNFYKSMGLPQKKALGSRQIIGIFSVFFGGGGGSRNHGSALTSHRLDPFFSFFVSFRVSLLRKRITASSVSTRCRKRLAGLLLWYHFPPGACFKGGVGFGTFDSLL